MRCTISTWNLEFESCPPGLASSALALLRLLATLRANKWFLDFFATRSFGRWPTLLFACATMGRWLSRGRSPFTTPRGTSSLSAATSRPSLSAVAGIPRKSPFAMALTRLADSCLQKPLPPPPDSPGENRDTRIAADASERHSPFGLSAHVLRSGVTFFAISPIRIFAIVAFIQMNRVERRPCTAAVFGSSAADKLSPRTPLNSRGARHAKVVIG